MEERYRQALDLVTMADLARSGERSYKTLQAYRSGYRRPTEAAARDLVTYLQARAIESTQAAERLEEAIMHAQREGDVTEEKEEARNG
ncbi:MAG: hypothetical protein IH921_13675 [Gemmatimonadetes bacterium]|nr:hypothetical protein [Gemmatimonadota bacterium]